MQLWSNITKTLNDTVGSVVQWRVYANDTSNNWNASQIFSLTTTDIKSPIYSNNQTQLVTAYTPTGYSNFSISWSDNSGLVIAYLESNFTGVLTNASMSGSYPDYYYNTSPLKAATYRFRFVANDSAGNDNATGWRQFTIAKTTPQTVLEVNETTVEFGDAINITAYASDVVLATVIYTNFSGLLQNITPPIAGVNTNITNTSGLSLAVYQISANATGNENYTSNATLETIYITTVDTTAPMFSDNGTNGTYAGYPAVFSVKWTDRFALSYYIFSTNNSGKWQNDSLRRFGEVVAGADTALLLHLNNDSAYGENDTHVYDFSGSGNNGTAKGGLTWTHKGKISGAFEFNTSDDYIQIANDNIVNATAGTFEAWIKPLWNDSGTLPSNYYVFDTSNDAGRYLLYRNSQSATLWQANIGGTPIFSGVELNLTNNTWYHIALTWDTAADDHHLYLNGVEVYHSTTAVAAASPGYMYIGNSYSFDSAFNGSIDEVAVYNRSLSAAEVRAHYENAKSNRTAWSNITKTLNATVGSIVQWRVYAKDSVGNWNTTPVWSLNTTFLDTVEPYFTDNTTNTTGAGLVCNFSVLAHDNVELSAYIFSTNNSGKWQNASVVTVSGADANAYSIATLNSTVGAVVQWRFYANDSSNNWATSEIYSLKTMPVRPPYFSNNATNGTEAGTVVNFTIVIKDETAVSAYIFSTNNSGKWQNASAVSVSSGSVTAWNTTRLNSTVGAVVQWRFYAKDNANNWNASQVFSLKTNSSISISMESNKMMDTIILTSPDRTIRVWGRVLYASPKTPFANKPLRFYYDNTLLGTNTTNGTGYYWFSFSMPHGGNFSFRITTNDTYGNTGENSTIMHIGYPSYARFRLSYMLGSSKADDVYRLGGYNESIDAKAINNRQYASNLSYGYVCTYDRSEYTDGLVLALVHSGDKGYLSFVNFSATASEGNYTAELKQQIRNTQLLIAYTKGDCQNLHDQMYMVERQTIPSQAFSSFSFGWPTTVPLLIRARYDNLDINGTDRFGIGAHRVCIENKGIAESNLPVIDVRRC